MCIFARRVLDVRMSATSCFVKGDEDVGDAGDLLENAPPLPPTIEAAVPIAIHAAVNTPPSPPPTPRFDYASFLSAATEDRRRRMQEVEGAVVSAVYQSGGTATLIESVLTRIDLPTSEDACAGFCAQN